MILFRRQLTSRALRYCSLRKELRMDQQRKTTYEVDDGRHIIELEISRNYLMISQRVKKNWVTDEEMVKLSENTR